MSGALGAEARTKLLTLITSGVRSCEWNTPGAPCHLCELVCVKLFLHCEYVTHAGPYFDNNYSPIEGRSFFCLPPPWLSGCIHQQTGNIFIIFIKTIKSNVAQMGLGGGMEAGLEGASACSGAYYHPPPSPLKVLLINNPCHLTPIYACTCVPPLP